LSTYKGGQGGSQGSRGPGFGLSSEDTIYANAIGKIRISKSETNSNIKCPNDKNKTIIVT
jgi:hypothetical protein